MEAREEEEEEIYLPKRLVARKGFSPSTLATIHTIKPGDRHSKKIYRR